MPHWDHGYFSNSIYTSSFYREQVPSWLDFASLVAGHEPPRAHEGDPFHYLELGSGMGLCLCLQAACYPEGQFIGVDFHPEHIAHSRWLVTQLKLKNIEFIEADFCDLCSNSSPLGLLPGVNGHFHYVAAHGIASWVIEPVQNAMLALASQALRPGGLFYCSYNTFPGWLGRTAFHVLSELELQRSDQSSPHAAYLRAATTLNSLLGPEEQPHVLGMAQPTLRADLSQIPLSPVNYLTQEYGSKGWAPMFVSDMHQRCKNHKLSPVASATLPDLFDDLLVESLHDTVLAEKNSLIRSTLIDLATNKAFRRDIFAKGSLSLSGQEKIERLGRVRLALREAPAVDVYSFNTHFGEVVGMFDICHEMEALLRENAQSLESLQAELMQPLPVLEKMAALLLHGNRIGLDRGKQGDAALSGCLSVNGTLKRMMQAGRPYEFLTSPTLGTGISVSTLETLFQDALAKGLNGEELAACIMLGAEVLGAELRDGDKKTMLSDKKKLEAINSGAENFRSQRLAALKAMKVIE
ncbi:class I SAM-dependent methyltransferase [Synechococcus sp. CS-1328]|uniref:class I SAM-dependent methyltransferase n=1 Tax=Synechococcus sp. CS-1328 TaxID=2847976 RepID=UPI00223ADA56|nr:class I SAM-dependent methyltransferase [Synechococcus sp. CS-1328]MCT0224856.1 class I SAM-dependent methyltransferase [Synechococcus sp. CS-1328]